MIPDNLTIQEVCQLIGYKELCNLSLGKQVEELSKQLAALQSPPEPVDATVSSAE